MRPFIELYIDNEKVEFQETPKVLFTYAHTDLHNPTVVKNSFSKTLTIDGTPKNNQIFGCFGDMNRITSYADGSYTGAYFNPSRKIDFILLKNSEPIERGYVKLDKVVKNGKQIHYEITLYGGLGQMLYSLTYGDDGEQLKLSSMKYDFDMDLEVNHTTIRDAWYYKNGIWGLDDYDYDATIYDFINFAPCYNGIPKDFTADKVAIKTDKFENVWETSKDGYSTVNGWILGELPKEYDEWQTKDLRSYLQRPVIRFKEIINACCNPVNNGGYTVDLDPEFFSEDNPYYENAWMTLPLVNEMETVDNTKVIDVSVDADNKMTLSGINAGDTFNFKTDYFITSDANVSLQSNGYGYRLTTGVYTFDGNTPLIQANMAIYSQLVAYDKDGNVITGSNVCSLSRQYGKIPTDFTYDLEYDAPVTFVNGTFYYMGDKENYNYRFFDDIEMGKYVGGDLPLHTLEIKDLEYREGMYFKMITKIATIDKGTVTGKAGKLFWTEGYDAYAVEPELGEKGSPMGTLTVKGKFINQKTLLNSEGTPCDYFLNYLKMFNLHIWSDNLEKKTYVRLRKNYFLNEKVDISSDVDRGSDVTITPISFDAKYYVFNNEVDSNSYLNNIYKDSYGFDYGIQKINTNYNFDNSSKNLIDKGIFKSVVCQRGKSRYYTDIYLSDWSTSNPVPPFVLDGIQTFLYKGDDTIEAKYITPKNTTNAYTWYGSKFLDIFPKPDFRDKDGKGIDGANVLLFYNGKQEMKNSKDDYMDFYISDDIPEFEELNDGEPCWIMAGFSENVVQINNLPVFSRYLTNENGWITHSWDFGTPKELYIDGWSIDDASSIYVQYWKPYMNDELDVNTRVVECMVKLRGNVNPDYLMKFVYFDKCYWKIQEIVDYDATSENTTKVRLVKINDLKNYLV